MAKRAALLSLLSVIAGSLGLLLKNPPPRAIESPLPLMRTAQAQHGAAAHAAGEILAPLDPEAERRQGDLLAARLPASASLSVDPEPVRALGRRLAASPLVTRFPNGYTFRVAAGRSINAHVLPGGHVFVMEGMVQACLDKPAELAFVLGHEIGHAELGHTADAVRYKALADRLLIGPVGDLAQLLEAAGRLHYSEVQELKADAFSLRLMRESDFDPAAGVRLIKRVLGDTGGGGPLGTVLWDYFRTHPGNRERASQAERHAARL